MSALVRAGVPIVMPVVNWSRWVARCPRCPSALALSVGFTTGSRALVWINAQLSNSTTATTIASYEVTGASSIAAADAYAIVLDSAAASSPMRGSTCNLQALTSGSNTFQMSYRVTAGTGTFLRRRIQVMGL